MKILVKRIDGALTVFFDDVKLTPEQLDNARKAALACKCARCAHCIIHFLATDKAGQCA